MGPVVIAWLLALAPVAALLLRWLLLRTRRGARRPRRIAVFGPPPHEGCAALCSALPCECSDLGARFHAELHRFGFYDPDGAAQSCDPRVHRALLQGSVVVEGQHLGMLRPRWLDRFAERAGVAGDAVLCVFSDAALGSQTGRNEAQAHLRTLVQHAESCRVPLAVTVMGGELSQSQREAALALDDLDASYTHYPLRWERSALTARQLAGALLGAAGAAAADGAGAGDGAAGKLHCWVASFERPGETDSS